MSTLKLAVPIITLFIALTQVSLEYWWHDKRTKKHKFVRMVLIFFLFCLTATSIFMIFRDEKQHTKLSKQISDIENASNEMNSKLAPFLDAAKRIYPTLETNKALEELSKSLNILSLKADKIIDGFNPRVLSKTDVHELVIKLSKYRGMKVKLRRSIGDLKMADLMDQIKGVFVQSGWIIDESSTDKSAKKGITIYGQGDEPGISVIKELSSVFRRKKFSIDLLRDKSLPVDTIGIDIGTR